MRIQKVLVLAVTAMVAVVFAGAQTPIEITVSSNLVRSNFRGVGFHAELFLDRITSEYFDQVIAKRWRELNPAFARVLHHWGPGKAAVRDEKALQVLARELLFMKEATDTEIYLTTGAMKATAPGDERKAYASAVADELSYLLGKGATNIKYYGSTNELSLHEWADLRNDLPTYRDYHRLIFEELKQRNIPVKLLATDASPVMFWNTLQWAADNMDDVTGVYGAHHYANNLLPGDLDFYGWFKTQCSWAVELAKAKNKDFILGEFGPGQYLELRWGIRWDTPEFYGTPQEPQAGLQVGEATLAAINAGAYAMAYWTFADFPDDPRSRSINQWGLFKSLANGGAVRAPYYCYGLLSKYLRGPASVHEVTTANDKLRVAAVEREADGSWSLAVINRDSQDAPLSIKFPKTPGKPFRKFVYDPANVPVTEDGDLQSPVGKVAMLDGSLSDTVKANSMAVYTTAYDDDPPAPVQGLEVKEVGATSSVKGMPGDAKRLTWRPNKEIDLCYYRIYHGGVRIASTVSTEFVDAGPTRSRPGEYTVVAVDTSGNASPR
jgi:hypothetical protein